MRGNLIATISTLKQTVDETKSLYEAKFGHSCQGSGLGRWHQVHCHSSANAERDRDEKADTTAMKLQVKAYAEHDSKDTTSTRDADVKYLADLTYNGWKQSAVEACAERLCEAQQVERYPLLAGTLICGRDATCEPGSRFDTTREAGCHWIQFQTVHSHGESILPIQGSTLEVHGCNLQESDKDAMKSN